MSDKIDKMVWDQFRLDPTDNARAHRIAKMMNEGKISFAGAEPEQAKPNPHVWYWHDLFKKEERKAARQHRTIEQLSTELEAAKRVLERVKAGKTRNTFHPDNRRQIWMASVAAAFEQHTCDKDENGFKIAWRVRERALEWFRVHLFHLASVDLSTLRTITLAMAEGADLSLMLGTSTRAGPPAVDWLKVRDKLQR